MWVDQRRNQRKGSLWRRVESGENRDLSNRLGSTCKTLNQRQHDRDVSSFLDQESSSFLSSSSSCSSFLVVVVDRWDPFLGLFPVLEKEVSGPLDSVEGVRLVRSDQIRSAPREEKRKREAETNDEHRKEIRIVEDGMGFPVDDVWEINLKVLDVRVVLR